MADYPSDEEKEISWDQVVDRYTSAGNIANDAMRQVVNAVKAGVTVRELCDVGDKYIEEKSKELFKKKKDIQKGPAFPTCISINNIVRGFSPLKSASAVVINNGDVVKIDLGVCIEGYPSFLAHTIVVGAEKDEVSGRKADVILAARNCAEAIIRLIKPGSKNTPISEDIKEFATQYQCNPVDGIMYYELKKNRAEGEKAIIQVINKEQKRESDTVTFEMKEAYDVNVIFSTGPGKQKETNHPFTVFRRTDTSYSLKSPSSRKFFSEVSTKYGYMPFSISWFDGETRTKLAVKECVEHQLLDPYHVTQDVQGEFVAQFRYTILLAPSGTKRITSFPFDANQYKSEFSLSEKQQSLISAPLVAPKKKKKLQGEDAAGVAGEVKPMETV